MAFIGNQSMMNKPKLNGLKKKPMISKLPKIESNTENKEIKFNPDESLNKNEDTKVEVKEEKTTDKANIVEDKVEDSTVDTDTEDKNTQETFEFETLDEVESKEKEVEKQEEVAVEEEVEKQEDTEKETDEEITIDVNEKTNSDENIVVEEIIEEENVEKEIKKETKKKKRTKSKKEEQDKKIEEDNKNIQLEEANNDVEFIEEYLSEIINPTTPVWEEEKAIVNSKMDEITIDADMDNVDMDLMLSKLSHLENDVRQRLDEVAPLYFNIQDLVDYVETSSGKGANASERKASGKMACISYRKTPDSEPINLYTYFYLQRAKYEFYKSKMEQIKNENGRLITLSAVKKLEVSLSR